jgi:calmodulin
MGHVNTKDEVIEAFRVFDKTGNGYISAKDLREALIELGDHMDSNEVYLKI